jgi:hypothetical protein
MGWREKSTDELGVSACRRAVGLNKQEKRAAKAALSRWLCQGQPPARPFFAVVVEHSYCDSMWLSRHTL